MVRSRCIGVFVLALVAAPSSAAQSTWWVDINAPAGGDGSQSAPLQRVQLGIDAASDGDTVRVLPGVYIGTIDFASKSIRVESRDGAAATILRGSRDGSVVVMNGIAPVLASFTVENGSGTADSWTTRGGGILFDGVAFATVEDCVVRENYAQNGGGIGSRFGNGVVRSCTIKDNLAMLDDTGCWFGSGGGVDAGPGASGVLVEDCIIRGNESGLFGGGLSGVTVTGSIVSGNVGPLGGGLYGGTAQLTRFDHNWATSCDGSYSSGGGVEASTISDCDVLDNRAYDDGGGASRSTLIRCRVVRNEAMIAESLWTRGGGAYDSTLIDCWIEGNVARGTRWGLTPSDGGGVYGGSALRCVLLENSADFGGGAMWAELDRCDVLENVGGGVHSSNVVNSVIAPNEGPAVSGEFGLVTYSSIAGGWPGLGNISDDPMMWDPLGGDLRLMHSSPCIDSGDPATNDPDGSRVDMGAFPYATSDCLQPIKFCGGASSADLACWPTIAVIGTPSVGSASGCELRASEVPGSRLGLVMFGVNGESNVPWGATSRSCVRPPRVRTAPQTSGGFAGTCNGEIAIDLNTWLVSNGSPLTLGTIVWAQAWYRDPSATFASNFSDAVRFSMCP